MTAESSDQALSPAEAAELCALDARINAILPPQYQGCYEDVQPGSMGSAALKFGPDGRVAWDEIWTSFCDLALAGGPPHRGTLLEPACAEEIEAAPEQYLKVVEETGRGIWMVTSLPVLPRFAPGWVGVRCPSAAMAAWLVRAIVVENVSARQEGNMLRLPAGPGFQLAKEIKNVITALAKTCHHWSSHMTADQQSAAAATFGSQVDKTELLQAALPAEARAAADEYQAAVDRIGQGIQRATGMRIVPSLNLGWVGVECADERMAIWILRAVIVDNILARRQGSVLYLPASATFTAGNEIQRVIQAFANAYRIFAFGQR